MERMLGENTTLETRRLSYDATKKTRNERQLQILEILKEYRDATANEIADEMFRRGYIYKPERNFASPRITELMQEGLVEPKGKQKDMYSKRLVTVFKLTNQGKELMGVK